MTGFAPSSFKSITAGILIWFNQESLWHLISCPFVLSLSEYSWITAFIERGKKGLVAPYILLVEWNELDSQFFPGYWNHEFIGRNETNIAWVYLITDQSPTTAKSFARTIITAFNCNGLSSCVLDCRRWKCLFSWTDWVTQCGRAWVQFHASTFPGS